MSVIFAPTPCDVRLRDATCDVLLRDGSTAELRPASEADVPSVREFFERLSPESRYHRFHGVPRLDDRRLRRLIAETPDNLTLLAYSRRQIVGVAGFFRAQPDCDRAEVAFAVADPVQGRGIATRLLERLAVHARERGITVFEADVQPDNRAMLGVFDDCGFESCANVASGITHVSLKLAPSAEFGERTAARARVAAAASIRAVLEPASVAVIGASRRRGKIGSEIFHNLVATGFTGRLWAVHPDATEIDGHTAHPSVRAIPGDVDLAIVAVPAADVLGAVDDCIAKGVRAICVISAGFAEIGSEGAGREAELLAKVRDAGCRLVGPNCMGLLNTDARIRLNATFSPIYPPAGNVAMSTQSGALGLAILDYARSLNIGISSFVSVGNKADVSSNDLIQYWADDPRTDVILLYLESFGNPRKFTELARRVGRTKPIVAVKSGRSASGARAASSHTGALAASDTVVDALFRQAGVIRTTTLDQLFDVAALLSQQPLPAGRRVAIVTNAGGPGILAADACEGHALELSPLADETRAELRTFLPNAASVGNPVDMLASATAEHYRRTVAAVLRDPSVDAAIVIFIPPLVAEVEPVAAAIRDAAAACPDKPIAAVMMRSAGAPASLAGIPCYQFPESAAIALARAVEHAEWRRRPQGCVPAFFDIRKSAVRAPVDVALARGGGWLSPDEGRTLLDAIGIPFVESRSVRTADQAVAAAQAIGFPVALKASGRSLLHKSDDGAVALDLRDGAAVHTAAADMTARLGERIDRFEVQHMVAGGVEMIAGAVDDAVFGPVVVCGSGGVLAELVADSACRLTPLTDTEAGRMLGELRASRLLHGYRGRPPVDEAALEDALLRLSTLLEICPEIRELDINPLMVLERGVCAVDVRVRVEQRKGHLATRRIVY